MADGSLPAGPPRVKWRRMVKMNAFQVTKHVTKSRKRKGMNRYEGIGINEAVL